MKFKKIEIDAFRVFENKEEATFDFTCRKDPSKVANLVAIYAPNGFGKTSFYDAVEWCMTNRISRLDHSKDLAHAEMEHVSDKAGENIRQYILKNRDVDKQQGKVTITFEKREPEERKTRFLRQGGWSDYYYKAPPHYKFPPKVENSYFKDVILSQEGIDAFLRMDDPRERYKKFVEYFDIAREPDKLRNNIAELIRENELRLKQNKDELKKLKSEIKSKKVSADIIEKTNNFIIELKKQDLIDLNELKPLNKDFSESDYNSLTLLINTLSTPGSQSRDEENEINNLIAQLPEYFRAKEEKQKLHSAQEEFQKILVLFSELKSLENVKNAKKKEISALEDKRKALEKFKELRPKYIEIQKRIDSSNREISKCKERIHENELKLTGLNSEIKKSIGALDQQKKELEELKTDRETIEEKFQSYTKNLDKRKDLSGEIEKNRKKLNAHEDERRRLKRDFLILQQLQNEINSGTVKSSKEEPPQYEKFYRELERLQRILKEMKETLNRLRGKAESINSLKETHNKIISFGRQYILTTKTTKCPLCGEKDYDDYNELLAQVETSGVLSELDEDIAGDIKKQEEVIQKSQKQYEDVLNNFGLKIGQDINTLNKKLDDLTNTVDIHLKQEKHLTHELDMINDKIMQYESRFSAKKVGVVKAELDEKIKKNEDELQAKNKILTDLEQKITAIQNDTIEIEENIGIEKEKISYLKNDPYFLNYIELIRVSSFLQEWDPGLTDKHVKDLQGKIGTIKAELVKRQEAIEELENKLQTENEQLVISNRETNDKRITQKEKTIIDYETRLKVYSIEVTQDMENMKLALNEKREEIIAKTAKLQEIYSQTLSEKYFFLKIISYQLF